MCADIYDYVEYMQYAQAFEQTLTKLEADLHISDDPDEIAMETLKAACRFYQGDWAGIVTADFDVNIWTPVWWYNPAEHDRTLELIREFESSESLNCWISSMQKNVSIMISDTEEVKKINPVEYELYRRLHVDSLLAVPFKPRPVGFLIVRNPRRYIRQDSMLHALSFVALTMVNEKKKMESFKMLLSPESIHKDTDVLFKVFGGFEIYTSKGVLRESDLNSPKICEILVYMLTSKRQFHPPLEIVETLWPTEVRNPETVSANLRTLIYRLRQMFSLISDYSPIETSASGYYFNPKLHIMTDMQNFDNAYQVVQDTSAIGKKLEWIRKAMEIFKGEIYPPASCEPWLVSISHNYSFRYISMVNELLSIFADKKEWSAVTWYASRALEIFPQNMRAYFWLIKGIYQTGVSDLAKAEFEKARSVLTEEEYRELVSMLRNAEEKL